MDLTVFEDLGYSRLGGPAGNSGFGVKVGVDLESVLIWSRQGLAVMSSAKLL